MMCTPTSSGNERGMMCQLCDVDALHHNHQSCPSHHLLIIILFKSLSKLPLTIPVLVCGVEAFL